MDGSEKDSITNNRYFQHAHLIPIVGVGKVEAHIIWSMVTCHGSTHLELP